MSALSSKVDVTKRLLLPGTSRIGILNIAITDAFNKEADGHTLYAAACTKSFSWNLPFSIATLADSPFDKTAFPTFLVNYDFPNQGRADLEDYFESIGVHVRPLDGSRVLTIDGVDASTIFKGLVGAYETVNPRYMRLMSRYSTDTVAGLYTQEVGSFGQRAFYPGADSVTVTLQTPQGAKKTVTIPWAATFLGSGNTTASFISETCLAGVDSVARKRKLTRSIDASPINQRRKAVVAPEAQDPPNLTSFGHFVTLDIYQLADHPKVGVVYFQQFEPSDGTGANTILQWHLRHLAAGVEKIIVDNSGNRGGFVIAGATALWSLWPQDLYPGFPASSDVAAASGLLESEYSYFFYRDLNYEPFQNNSQFLDPPVPQIVNGVQDAYSKQFLRQLRRQLRRRDELLPRRQTTVCALRSLVERPSATVSQFDGGVKGSEITSYDEILFELELAGLDTDPRRAAAVPSLRGVHRGTSGNAIPYIDQKDGILDFNKPQKIWEFVAEEFFGH
ncbi:hypothetical protein B0H14DRAFT_3487694 [Mycena olivaceomarginata]|nr:hypothetical protein B0H14DRAFT_3487694 [Mycena olivaceomarginata]